MISKMRLIFQLVPRQDAADSILKRNSRSSAAPWIVKGRRTSERMQSANKAWWRDVKMYRSKDVRGGTCLQCLSFWK